MDPRAPSLDGLPLDPSAPDAGPDDAGGAGSLDDGIPVVTAHGVDDLLGYIGHTLGTLPEHSLVLLTLRGARLRAVVRVDLPTGTADADATARWAASVAGVCRRDAEATGTLALVLDAGAEPGDAPPPHWWAGLAAALGRLGMPVQEGWCTTGRYAWPWPAPGRGRGPGGPPCAVDPQISPLALHLLGLGSVWGLRDRELLAPVTAHARGEQVPPWSVPPVAGVAARRAWSDAWEEVLRGGPVRDACLLGAPLVLSRWRDGLVLTAACGPDTSAAVASARRRERVLTASTATAPDWPRLDRLWEACREIAVVAPPPQAQQALAVAAWVSWARGHGSAAAAQVRAAVELDAVIAPEGAGDGFVRVLQALCAAGLVSGWASSPETAWRAGSGAPRPGGEADA